MLTTEQYRQLLNYSKKGAELPSGTLDKMHEFEKAHDLLEDLGNGVTRIKSIEIAQHKQSLRQRSV